jgi:diguanylate cyclase (GGDEF)-like protein
LERWPVSRALAIPKRGLTLVVTVYWLDYLLGFRLFLITALLLGLAFMAKRVIRSLGMPVFGVMLTALIILLLAQCAQYYAHEQVSEFWTEAAAFAFTLAGMVVFAGVGWGIWVSSVREQEHQETDRREQWLMQVYDNIPAAVYVIQDQQVTYSNHVFKRLQKQFNLDNPFSQVKQGQQDIWLTTQSGERFAFWMNQFSLDNVQGQAYIVTDITSVKLQGSFIQKVAKDINSQNKTTIHSVLSLVHEFVPSSILYVGEYNADSGGYKYLTHQGSVDSVIYSDTRLNESKFNNTDWSWFDVTDVKNGDIPNLVKNISATFYGGIVLADDLGAPLGIILLMQTNKIIVSDLLVDFLSIFSNRVRAELEHRQDKRLIEKSSNRYRAFIESSNEAIADIIIQPSIYVDDSVTDQWENIKKQAKLKEVNPAFTQLFGFGKTPNAKDFLAIKSLKHMMNYVLESGYSSEEIEVAHEDENGEIRWLSCTVMADIEERQLHRLWIILRDITDRKTHIRHLEHQARHDSLTGLGNRIALRECLEEKIDQANQFGFKTALILIDLDRFKEINDALGHHYGDVLLKKIEPRIRNIVNEKRGFFARLGGDEFALVVPSVENTEEANQIAFEIVKKLREPFDLGQLNVEIGCSIGIAFYPEDGNEPSTLMRCADVAMYKAKKATSGVLTYSSEMDESSPRRLALMADMNKGLRNNEFFLVYQPKLDLATNEIYAAEALLRWQHSELELINPSEFIPLAEMSDVIISMTQWVIDETLRQIKEWMNIGLYIKTSVNVSTRNLLDDDLIGFIKEKLAQYQVPANMLEIEITESALMVDPERALHTLNKISEMGVSISVDDFGTGYSSLIYLRQLPIDTLKIDIMFVRTMCINDQDEIIVNSIINLAHNLSLNVVAEGAEDLMTMERLKAMQCNMAQGYYVSKPILPEDFLLLLQGWKKSLHSS